MFGAAALIFWAVTDRDALVEVDHPSKNEAQVEIKSEKVTATTNLGALTNEVKPLDLTTRVVVSGREHAHLNSVEQNLSVKINVNGLLENFS